MGIAGYTIAGISVFVWTIIAFVLIWLIVLFALLWLRLSNLYTLLTDSLEIKTGVFTVRHFAVAASGFADLEIVQGILGRLAGYGDIIIRTQSEKGSQRIMLKVQNPRYVADKIKVVLSRSLVRVT